MPQGQLPEAVAALFAKPNPAVMATIHPDGYPVSVATWYLLEDDGTVLLNLDGGRARLAHLRANPQVSLTALSADDWYTHVSVQGTVDGFEDDADLTDIDRLSRHYTGRDYPTRDRARVSVHLRIARWHGWGATAHKG